MSELVDLRLGDVTQPPVEERVRLVTCPFRSFLHLLDDEQRLRALGAVRELLVPGGRFVFDVFAPGPDDIQDTHGRWLEREPGIFERADWDTQARTLKLSVRGNAGATSFMLAWLSPKEWSRAARARRLPGARLLRLVRQAPVHGRRGHHLDRPAPGLDELDLVADGDFA